MAESWDVEACRQAVSSQADGWKWVFRKKRGPDGSVVKWKARICAHGFLQRPGIDFNHTFAPVISFKSLRSLLAITAVEDLDLCHMDVKVAFLNGVLPENERVYMSVPAGLNASAGQVCELRKGLFGLKQSPRIWNNELNRHLESLGFTRCITDPCLYVRRVDGELLIVGLFVDDLAIASSSTTQRDWLKGQLTQKYSMTDEGDLTHFLGLQIERDREARTLKVHQARYIEDVLERFNMQNCDRVSTPAEPKLRLSAEMGPTSEDDIEFMKSRNYRSAVGSLMYAMVATR